MMQGRRERKAPKLHAFILSPEPSPTGGCARRPPPRKITGRGKGGTKSRIFSFRILGAGVTPAQGSVKPTEGFHYNKVPLSIFSLLMPRGAAVGGRETLAAGRRDSCVAGASGGHRDKIFRAGCGNR